MKFKIGEISKLSGFSPSGIRFFEEAGVISPVRGSNEKYREYSLNDLQRLLICRKYRECGFSLQESVEMLLHANVSELKKHVAAQAACLEKSINEKQALLEFLDQQTSDIEAYEQSGAACSIQTMPALIWLKLWQPGDAEEDVPPLKVVYEWINHGPFTNSCLLLPVESLLAGRGELATIWGTAIEERFGKKLGFSQQTDTQYFPACECVRAVVTPSAALTIASEQLQPAREFISHNGYRVTGHAFSRFFYSTINTGEFIRYDHLWIPIDRV